jgi:drug/metabolite transporter (DMT)-like permease
MQTVKSLVPAFTVVLQVVLFRQPSPTLIYLSLVPVVGGVALASFTEVNFNMVGFLTALVASLTTSKALLSPLA